MEKLKRILDTYEFDGLYNDLGYDGDCIQRIKNGNDSLEGMEYDPYLEDLLVRIYSLVKEQNGICKIHQNCSYCPITKDKIYDYLWIGEAVKNDADLRKAAAYEPYVIVAPDYKRLDVQRYDRLLAQSLPFLQFLIRYDGRPVTGEERISVPGIEYIQKGERSFFKDVSQYNKSHPNGPYVYSEWSSIPDDPMQRKKWEDYLTLYKPMVTENSICYLDIHESLLTKEPIPEDVHMSLFINEEKYICISNTGDCIQRVVMSDAWLDRGSNERVQEITLMPNDIKFLKHLI